MPFPRTPVVENLFRRRATVSLDIIVVGGSIGGLSAAYNLKQAGHTVRVLEKLSGELEVSGGMRVPPNMARLMQHWGLGKQLMEKAVQCPKIDFLEGATGDYQSSLVYHKELMRELQAEMYGMHYADLHDMVRELAVRSGVRIEYNTQVVDIDVHRSSVLLAGGKRLRADLIVGADGVRSLTREKIVGYKEVHKIGPYTTYTYIVPVSAMKKDPKLKSLVQDGTWTLWTGSVDCVLSYLVRPSEYVVHIIEPHEDAKPGWENVVPLSKLDVSQFEDRVQRLVALGTRATETLHVVQKQLQGWYSDNGRAVLVGSAAHVSCPSSTNEAALAMEDGAVLGSLFSRLQTRDTDEILRLLRAYQEMRQDRCTATVQSDCELVAFSTLPAGPERNERDEGFRLSRMQQSLDWEKASEDILRGAWEEFRASFGYEAYDAADDWWVDWGIMLQRMTAVESMTSKAAVATVAPEDGYESDRLSRIPSHSPILRGLKIQASSTRL
ncbi:hypothetical protein M0805_009804 [Coniferiporia weirii]|nr:hypothetical protein M0805_009804 [Coniferiporia weirii]